jgi:uncharacterized protein (TIGR02145 family)
MKKLFYFMVLATLAVFSSCSSESDDTPVSDISLNQEVLALPIGEDFTLTATVLPENATKPTITWKSSDETKAKVVNGKVSGIAEGEVNITAKAGSKTATCKVTVFYDPTMYDDGVIIAGKKWATRNLAAPRHFANNPKDYGMFYQWNRKTGWSATNPLVGTNGATSWDASIPSGTAWTTENNICPQGWRIPTSAELQELISAGSQEEITSGVLGRKFGTAPNTIFLPAAGGRVNSDGSRFNEVNYGYYWSSTPAGSGNISNNLYFSANANIGSFERNYGFSIRCIAE